MEKKPDADAEHVAFLQEMVVKCEVKSFDEIYRNLVDLKGGSVRCEEIFSKNAKFSIPKIKTDVLPISDIILLYLFDPSTGHARNQPDFKKLDYLVNLSGLKRVITFYRKENFIPAEMTWEKLLQLWEIRKEEEQKLHQMIEKLIETNRIYAKFISQEGKEILKFLSILDLPQKAQANY